MNKHLPRVLIAAPKSGSGKTMITCGILNLLKRQSNNVTSFKCGPDYIDPMFHRKVLGIDGGNLDSFFMDDESIRRVLGNVNAELVVIEGVMGIYDGLELTSTKASAYDVASVTDTPVILVVDGKGAGKTLISSIKGILADDNKRLIKGIIINNISSVYFDKLKPVIEKELADSKYDVTLIGNVPCIKNLNIDSRHLGLMMPDEIKDLNLKIDAVSDAIEENCSIDKLLGIMNCASEITYEDEAIKHIESRNLRIAVARDDAFCFYYRENLELLKIKGLDLVEFSPLNDARLPDNISGILLGGGYPENHLQKLSANKTMLEDIRIKINNGIPTLAECGGFMYLHKTIADINGQEYEMAGVIEGACNYTGKLVRFGYVKMNPGAMSGRLSDNITNMCGHEFHYYDSTCNGDSLCVTKPSGSPEWSACIATENSLFGFPHMYYQSDSEFIDAFIKRMESYNE